VHVVRICRRAVADSGFSAVVPCVVVAGMTGFPGYRV